MSEAGFLAVIRDCAAQNRAHRFRESSQAGNRCSARMAQRVGAIGPSGPRSQLGVAGGASIGGRSRTRYPRLAIALNPNILTLMAKGQYCLCGDYDKAVALCTNPRPSPPTEAG